MVSTGRELNTGFSSRPMTDVTISLDGGQSKETLPSETDRLLDHGLSHKFYRDAILESFAAAIRNGKLAC